MKNKEHLVYFEILIKCNCSNVRGREGGKPFRDARVKVRDRGEVGSAERYIFSKKCTTFRSFNVNTL